MSRRTGIFVGLIERGLGSLKPGGTLAFICADRWTRNQCGRTLRQFVSDSEYSVALVLSTHSVDAFEEQVSAYAAITVTRTAEQGPAVVADANSAFGPDEASELPKWSTDPSGSHSSGRCRSRRGCRRPSTWSANRSPSPWRRRRAAVRSCSRWPSAGGGADEPTRSQPQRPAETRQGARRAISMAASAASSPTL